MTAVEEMKIKLRKGLWSPDEDEKLSRCIAMYMNGSWSDIAKKAGLQRCGKSCRRRWMNHLRPDLKRGRFTPAEISRVVDLHNALGNRWSEIASHLVGRTDNDVKNLWNTQIKRQFKTQQPLTVAASAVDIAAGEQLDAGTTDTSITSATYSQSVSSDIHTLMEETATIAMSSAEYQNKVNRPSDVDHSKLTAYQQENPSTVGKAINIKSVFSFPFRCDDSQHQAELNTEDVLHEDMSITRGARNPPVPRRSPIMQNRHAIYIPHALSSSNLSKLGATVPHELLATSTTPDQGVKYAAQYNAHQGGQKGALHLPPIQFSAHDYEHHSFKNLWHLPVPASSDESTPVYRSIIELYNSLLVGPESEAGTSNVSSITSASSDVQDYANSCSWWSSLEEIDFHLPEPTECWQPLSMFEL